MAPPEDQPASGTESPAATETLSLLAAADIGVVQLTPAGVIAGANDAFVRLTGRPRERLLGTPIANVVSTVPATLEAALDGDSATADRLTFSLPVEAADGDVVTCEAHFECVDGDDGRDEAFVGTLHRRSESSTWPDSPRELESKRDHGVAPAKAFIALANSLSDGIIVLDAASEVQYANPAVERILGYSPEELVGGSKLDIVPERLRETHLEALNRYLETGERHVDWEYVELPGQHRDGHEVPLGISFNDFTFDGDRYFVGLFRDVSARKDAQEALRERERQLDQYRAYTDDVLDAIDDMFYVLDEDGELQRWNRTLCDVTGYADDEVASMHALDFVEDDDRAAIAAAIRDGFETGSTRVEADLLTREGETVSYEFVGAALTDPDGNPVLAGVGRDIDERRAQRREIEESERRYRTIVEHFPNGVVALFDTDLRFTAIGGELLDALGIESRDAIGESIAEHTPGVFDEAVESHFEAALDGEIRTFELEFRDRDLAAYALPVRDDDDIFAGMVMVQDVTERKEIRQRLEESNDRLEQFAYAASHDLQEPLRMVTSYLQLIERRYGDELDEDAEEFLEFAVDGAERMREMIEGLLEYSRVDTQGGSFEPVDLNAVVDDVRDDLRIKIEESGAKIGVGELPRVAGDGNQLRQVFQNLLSNAIEYSGDATPEIAVAAERLGDEWRVSVADNGIGIGPDETEYVFQVFHRLHSRDEHAGTGLGLALCQRIVDRHGGRIWVESTEGEGSTFYVTLPAVDAVEE